MRIAIVTDAWQPQVNGVVRTLSSTRDELEKLGHTVAMVTPTGRRTVACPGYPEIRLALFAGRSVRRELDAFDPDCVHVATEGPMGFAARRYCLRRKLPFTSAYHTQFPEYLRARLPIPIRLTSRILRWFHRAAAYTMVPTESVRDKLAARGFRNLVIWSRGVDTTVFRPRSPHDYGLPRPVSIYMGRVAVEKNIDTFLQLNLPGSKVVIGDGPDLPRLRRDFPDCHFTGYQFGEELASYLSGGDLFVFPSKTDTFGLVMLEAMACGLPVAAFPADGPIDVVRCGETGILGNDLEWACLQALSLSRDDCRAYAVGRSWRSATRQFASYLVPRTRATASDQPANSALR